MNELVSLIAQKTGIGEDKAQQVAEVVVSFFRTKFPALGGQLDNLQGGAASEKASGLADKVKEGLGLGKKIA